MQALARGVRTVLDGCACPFVGTGFINTLKRFKAFMLGDAVPNYVHRYCGDLTGSQWGWFYGQMAAALKLTDEPEYLFYVLKWILKYDFDDLAYEMYCQDIMNPECREEPLIKPSEWPGCAAKYHERFTVEHEYMWTADHVCDTGQVYTDVCVDGYVCDAGGDLPF